VSATERAVAPTSTGETRAEKKLKSVARKAFTPGQVAAAEIERAAAAQREGKPLPEPIENDELVEDWQNDLATAAPAADPALAGLYRVKHGNLFLGPGKLVRGPRERDGQKLPGRKVKLTASDARTFLEQGLVERLD
jgi:hypothetical protein